MSYWAFVFLMAVLSGLATGIFALVEYFRKGQQESPIKDGWGLLRFLVSMGLWIGWLIYWPFANLYRLAKKRMETPEPTPAPVPSPVPPPSPAVEPVATDTAKGGEPNGEDYAI